MKTDLSVQIKLIHWDRDLKLFSLVFFFLSNHFVKSFLNCNLRKVLWHVIQKSPYLKVRINPPPCCDVGVLFFSAEHYILGLLCTFKIWKNKYFCILQDKLFTARHLYGEEQEGFEKDHNPANGKSDVVIQYWKKNRKTTNLVRSRGAINNSTEACSWKSNAPKVKDLPCSDFYSVPEKTMLYPKQSCTRAHYDRWARISSLQVPASIFRSWSLYRMMLDPDHPGELHHCLPVCAKVNLPAFTAG